MSFESLALFRIIYIISRQLILVLDEAAYYQLGVRSANFIAKMFKQRQDLIKLISASALPTLFHHMKESAFWPKFCLRQIQSTAILTQNWPQPKRRSLCLLQSITTNYTKYHQNDLVWKKHLMRGNFAASSKVSKWLQVRYLSFWVFFFSYIFFSIWFSSKRFTS